MAFVCRIQRKPLFQLFRNKGKAEGAGYARAFAFTLLRFTYCAGAG